MSQSLFPGWRPEAEDRSQLALLAATLPGLRPADAPVLQLRRPDQWHITLCFIGYDLQHLVTPRLLQAFERAATRIPPHRFTLERIVYWPQSGAVAALPHHCPALQALCDATRDALRSCGVRPQQVTNQPHITLGYLGRHHPEQRWLQAVNPGPASFGVERFELLFNPGGRYEPLGAWALSGTELPRPPEQGALL